MKHSTLFLLLLGIAMSYSTDQLRQMYREKKEEYNMNFLRSTVDEKEHFLEFCKFANMVEKHNKEDGAEWQAEINQFALMTEAERNLYLGLNISSYMESMKEDSTEEVMDEDGEDGDGLTDTSETVDWSHKLPQPKGQGACGSCWTFPPVAALEYQVNKDSETIKTLSEQQYLDCVYGKRDGCKGGMVGRCSVWTMNNNNMLAYAEDYPYVAKSMKCKKKNMPSALTEAGIKLVDKKLLGMYNTKAILKAVKNPNLGVLISIVKVSGGFQAYKKGVFSSPNCNKNAHAVAIVGYGESKGLPYWKIRNSWSRGWGEKGYMRIKRGVKMCDVEKFVSHPIIERKKPNTGTPDEEDLELEQM